MIGLLLALWLLPWIVLLGALVARLEAGRE